MVINMAGARNKKPYKTIGFFLSSLMQERPAWLIYALVGIDVFVVNLDENIS